MKFLKKSIFLGYNILDGLRKIFEKPYKVKDFENRILIICDNLNKDRDDLQGLLYGIVNYHHFDREIYIINLSEEPIMNINTINFFYNDVDLCGRVYKNDLLKIIDHNYKFCIYSISSNAILMKFLSKKLKVHNFINIGAKEIPSITHITVRNNFDESSSFISKLEYILKIDSKIL